MRTPGTPHGTVKHSPLSPASLTIPAHMPVDDISGTEVRKGSLRKRGGTADHDAALGTAGKRGRTKVTAESATHRVMARHAAYSEPEYPGLQGGGRTMPSVMGQAQNFNQSRNGWR